MTALEELRAGAVGDAFAGDLRRTIRAVAVSRNFPPPEGFRAWDADAVGSTVAEFMSDAQTPRRLTDLALHCVDEAGLRARLQGCVRNFLADLGRRTPIGKLVIRINDVMSGEAAFVRVDGRWGRKGGAAEPGRDDPDLLARSISAMTVVVPAWGHDARREAPVADRQSVVAMCGALVDAAGGSLAPRVLARAIGHRLGLGQAPLSLDADGLDGGAGGGGGAGGADIASEAVRYLRATEVLAELNVRERLALAYPELTVRDLAPVLGVSASQSHLVRRRAAEIVRTELMDDDDAEGVALVVLDLARSWAETVDKDATSAVLVGQ